MQGCALLIFAKTPTPGSVKTRLIPSLGETGATRLYVRLLKRLVHWIAHQTSLATELWVTPDQDHPLWKELTAEHNVSLYLQQGDDLGARMGFAAQQALKRHRHVAIIGVDCPALNVGHIRQTFHWLSHGEDAVLGPVEDGGYALLGLNKYHQRLFEGHRWGSENVADSTRAVLADLGWCYCELPQLWDLDRPGDLERLKDEYPALLLKASE
jgi:rSAM/selenodomain-associated transferase 1